MSTQTPSRPIPTRASSAPGTAILGARVASVLAAFAVGLSPTGASSQPVQAAPPALPGQLSLFADEACA